MTSQTPTTPKIVSLSEIEKAVAQAGFHDKLVQGLADGFVQFQNGEFGAAPIQTLGAPPLAPFVADCDNYAAQTCVKSGYFTNNPYYVIKVASGGHPLPNAGCMQVYSQTTGRLLALFLDEGLLTELRTAAWSAMVFKLWHKKSLCSVSVLGIVGTGVQAMYQLAALANETFCRHVVIYGRTPSKVEAMKSSLEQEGWKTVQVVDDPNDLLAQCDVVITTTPARQPVLTAPTATRTRLLLTVGADAVGKTELDSTLVQSAVLRIADHATQSRVRGEFQGCSEKILNLGDWIRKDASPLPDHGLVIADSSGVALQDCVIAQMVYESL